jgi:hypothetical protein
MCTYPISKHDILFCLQCLSLKHIMIEQSRMHINLGKQYLNDAVFSCFFQKELRVMNKF